MRTGMQLLLRGKKTERYLPETLQWLKNISILVDSFDHSDIDSNGSAELNTENMNPHNRGSNTDTTENINSASNARRLSRTLNPPTRFGEAYTH